MELLDSLQRMVKLFIILWVARLSQVLFLSLPSCFTLPTSTEYTVVSEISCAKIAENSPLDKVCLFGCGVSTGLGAAWKTANIEAGSSVAVFGLGAVGLAIIQGAKARGASKIFAIDVNPLKFEFAQQLGATDCINPTELPAGTTIQSHIVSLTTWGVDYTFDATGNTQVMRAALESAHRGWGQSIVVGVAPAGHEISTRPFQLITGRQWKGTAFGGFKSRTEVPQLVNQYLSGELPIDHFITHRLHGVENISKAIDLMHEYKCLRAVVEYQMKGN